MRDLFYPQSAACLSTHIPLLKKLQHTSIPKYRVDELTFGKETAKVLSLHGANVAICCRNTAKGEEAKADILKTHPDASIAVFELDLGSLASIRKFAKIYAQSGRKVHVLINNAGVMACSKSFTSDGFENQFGTNHVGHFYLTALLVPLIHSSCQNEAFEGRVVNLSSHGQALFAPSSGIFWDDLQGALLYSRYGQSKLANILHAFDLNAKMIKNGFKVRAVSVHPGNITSTDLIRHMNFYYVFLLLWSINKRLIWKMFESKNIQQGTSSILYCAAGDALEWGKYYEDCQVSKYFHPMAYNEECAQRLTTVSIKLINERLEDGGNEWYKCLE